MKWLGHDLDIRLNRFFQVTKNKLGGIERYKWDKEKRKKHTEKENN
jgi:hypothetical protein